MYSVDISLNTIDKVKDFVNIISKENFEADLTHEKYIVDAKSIMGILSLNLSKTLKLIMHTDNADELNAFKTKIKDFIV